MASKNKNIYDRFVSSRVINCLIRPQKKGDCSISAITVAMNTVFASNLSIDDVIKRTEWDLEKQVWKGHIGNDEIISAFTILCQSYHLKGKGDMLFSKVPRSNADIDSVWNRIKEDVKNPNSVLIYHANDSYSMIAGYFEEPINSAAIGKTSFAYRKDWLILAENISSSKTPLRLLNWEDAQEELRESKYYGIIRLSSKGKKVILKQKIAKRKTDSGTEIIPASVVSRTTVHSPAAPLKLSRKEKEELNNKIFDKIDRLIEHERMTFLEACINLANRSKKALGYELSPKALEGRYNRHPETIKRRKSKSEDE